MVGALMAVLTLGIAGVAGAQSPIPPGPERCEGIVDQAEFEACVAQGGPVVPEAPTEQPIAAPVPAPVTATSEVLPDTGGASILALGVGIALVGGGLLVRKK